MDRIYLVSEDDGAAYTNSERCAAKLEAAGLGFRRCSHEEWQAKRRRQQRDERRETGGANGSED